jgi:16S rRNA (adenine1518-N6/adenine1519-N6)-dimethyltransferase
VSEGALPRAKKSLGQNFLVDPRTALRIAQLATPTPGGTVLEIGPGTGALTRPLLERAARVIALELDRELAPRLEAELASFVASGALEVELVDALQVDWVATLASGPEPRFVAGNVPYLITGQLLRKATTIARHVSGVVLMVQREVADRIVARPGADAYGALSVFVQAAFAAERALLVPAGAFRPRPKVDSAVVRLVPHATPRAHETPAFRELVTRAFQQRRKQLRNAWRGVFGWDATALERAASAAGIELSLRGETLAVEDFARLAELGAPLARDEGSAGVVEA